MHHLEPPICLTINVLRVFVIFFAKLIKHEINLSNFAINLSNFATGIIAALLVNECNSKF